MGPGSVEAKLSSRARLLIVKLGSIGDIIHALPVLDAIRTAMPEAEISWAVEERSAEILRGNSLIDNLIELDTRSLRKGRLIEDILPELRRQLKGLRKYRFDVAFDLQGLLKSAMIAKLSGAKLRYGFARGALREPASRFLLNKAVEIQERTHVIRKNLKLVGDALGIPVPSTKFAFPITTEVAHRNEAREAMERIGGRFAILNPAGGWPTKLWPAENYGKLAELIYNDLGIVPVVTTGPGEARLRNAVIANCGIPITAIQPSLKGFYEIAKQSVVYIGGDTGPTHLAVAAGTPVVGIFGPTEWWRNGSTDPFDICVGRKDIACRIDCHRRRCSKWICMEISVETVFEAVRKRIGE